MAAINQGAFTFNQEELQDLSQVIHELVYNNEDLRRLHDVQEGVKWNKQIVFAGKIGLMGKAVTGCTPNEIEGVTLTQKTWTPVKEDFRLSHCSTDTDMQNKLVNQMAKMNPDFYDVIQGSQSGIGQFLVAKVLEGFIESLLRKAWFSDTAVDNVANGGVLTDGVDKGYFDTFDGLFKQLFVNIPTTSKYYVEAPRNNGATFAAQELQPNDAINTLRAMYKKADTRLKGLKGGVSGAQFYLTQSMWDCYESDLENIQNQGAGNTAMTENGVTTLTFKGYPVLPMPTWDRNIEAYFNNGTVYDKPNRAVFSTAMNLPLATLAASDFGEVDAFYDKTTKKNYIDGIYSIDVKHLENYLTVVAY